MVSLLSHIGKATNLGLNGLTIALRMLVERYSPQVD
ncbi:hypothetical protein BamMEX5DRAFT_3488 [Burkholderia ambifaria MEX-5]|uniref:Uncharacterized protein n=1 Tax=Burkholderia ambifaria MEX-5 TaxID=396597 RepID=B1T6S2_9BURK|nr:hypothetical protein BamMEX5DRAFT_3488 [Burkholderia ambifaria MEX-5]